VVESDAAANCVLYGGQPSEKKLLPNVQTSSRTVATGKKWLPGSHYP
jgi:hypothetical protein